MFPLSFRYSYDTLPPSLDLAGNTQEKRPEGWDGEGGGRGVQGGEHVYTLGGFKPMDGKTNTML